PRLDVSPSARPHGVPGPALPARFARGVRRESLVADLARRGGSRQDRLAGDRGRPRHAAQLPREQALVVPETALRRLVGVAVAALVLIPVAHAAQTQNTAHLTKAQAKQIFLADAKVADWLSRYPRRGPTVTATYEPSS